MVHGSSGPKIGKADILWRDTAGNLVVSLMNGTTITSSAFIASLP